MDIVRCFRCYKTLQAAPSDSDESILCLMIYVSLINLTKSFVTFRSATAVGCGRSVHFFQPGYASMQLRAGTAGG